MAGSCQSQGVRAWKRAWRDRVTAVGDEDQNHRIAQTRLSKLVRVFWSDKNGVCIDRDV